MGIQGLEGNYALKWRWLQTELQRIVNTLGIRSLSPGCSLLCFLLSQEKNSSKCTTLPHIFHLGNPPGQTLQPFWGLLKWECSGQPEYVFSKEGESQAFPRCKRVGLCSEATAYVQGHPWSPWRSVRLLPPSPHKPKPRGHGLLGAPVAVGSGPQHIPQQSALPSALLNSAPWNEFDNASGDLIHVRARLDRNTVYEFLNPGKPRQP